MKGITLRKLFICMNLVLALVACGKSGDGKNKNEELADLTLQAELLQSVGNTEQLKKVLAKKPNINFQAQRTDLFEADFPSGCQGYTPIHWAVLNHETNLENIKLLVDAGADPTLFRKEVITNGNNSSNMFSAIHETIVHFGDDTDTLIQRKNKILKYFIASGFNIDQPNPEHINVWGDKDGGDTPLLLSVKGNDWEGFTTLFQAGANPNIHNSRGETIWNSGVVTQPEIMKQLLKYGQEKNVRLEIDFKDYKNHKSGLDILNFKFQQYLDAKVDPLPEDFNSCFNTGKEIYEHNKKFPVQ